MKRLFFITSIIILFFYSYNIFSQTQINSLGSYVWNGDDEPKTFNNKLQLSFVQLSDNFPQFGTVVAGGGYSNTQDGSAFQLYFPYNETYGGNAPKVRLGIYPNADWSNWETFYTTANANKSDIDWVSKNIIAYGKIGIGTTRNLILEFLILVVV